MTFSILTGTEICDPEGLDLLFLPGWSGLGNVKVK